MVRSFVVCSALLLLAACSSGVGGADVHLLPIPDRTVTVDATLVVSIAVDNPKGVPLEWSYDAPTVALLDRVTLLAGTPSGAEFRWTPLASQVGTHELSFTVSHGGGRDTVTTRVTVQPAASAAPVFLRPGAGGAFDLARDPCVAVDVEVRDDDSEDVTVRLGGQPPEGAGLTRSGPKSAALSWCPTPDQVDAAQRWSIVFEADDHDHAPVAHEFVAVLQRQGKDGCPGAAPVVAIRQPAEGARVASFGGYEVVVDATDDRGLRDAPLLYWTTGGGGDVDVTGAEQIELVDDGGQWRARVPPLGLEGSEELQVRIAVVATDNDDPDGAACDHTTYTATRTFVASAGTDSAVLEACEPCWGSAECSSGICAVSGGAGLCVDPCARCAGACAPATTRSGGVADACVSACTATADCTDGPGEPGPTPTLAAELDELADGFVCTDDVDVWSVAVGASGRLEVTLEFVHATGDLDLRLLDEEGVIVASSAGTENTETVAACARAGDVFYAEVFGYAGDTGDYIVGFTEGGSGCGDGGCDADAYEPNDVRADAAFLAPGLFDGTLCDGDDDWYEVVAAAGTEIEALVTFDGSAADLDLELFDPDGGLAAESRGTDDDEYVSATSVGGAYLLHVYRYDGDPIPYEGLLELGGGSGAGTVGDACDTGADCAGARVCLDLPGGYCTAFGCDVTACGAGSVCVAWESEWICARDCALGDFVCRSGYDCAVEFDPSDDVVFACLP